MGHGHDSHSAAAGHGTAHSTHAAADTHGHVAHTPGDSRFGTLAVVIAFVAYALGWATRPSIVEARQYPENAGPGYYEPLPAVGPANASVVVVEVIEFKCGFCAKHHGYMKRLIAEHGRDVRFVIKHMPPIGDENESELAAIASMAANRQARYWDYAEHLLQNQNVPWTREVLVEYAKKLGLDPVRFRLDLQDPALRSYVRKDTAAGRELDIRGTPSIFVNGRALPDNAMMRADPVVARDMIRDARARVAERVKRGEDPLAARAADAAEGNPAHEAFAKRYILNDVADLQVDFRNP